MAKRFVKSLSLFSADLMNKEGAKKKKIKTTKRNNQMLQDLLYILKQPYPQEHRLLVLKSKVKLKLKYVPSNRDLWTIRKPK